MKRFFIHQFIITGFVFVWTMVALSAEPAVMQKIRYQNMDPDLPTDSFWAKPWTVYRSGTEQGRVEEPMDPQRNVQMIFIKNGPDFWLVNSLKKYGRSMKDPGPTFHFKMPAIPEFNKKSILPDLQIGREVAFFLSKPFTKSSVEEDSINCELWTLTEGLSRVDLVLEPSTQKPRRLIVTHGGDLVCALRYLIYENSLPYDPALFIPPPGVRWMP